MNNVLQDIRPSDTLAITAKAKKLAAEGFRVCNFAAGEPDFDTPPSIKDAAIASLSRGETKYTPARGLPALCKAIAEKLKRENGLEYDEANVIVGGGAKMSLSTAFMALLNPGDEVIIPAPYWLSYPEMVRLAGGVPVFVKGDDLAGFRITSAQLEAAITPRTVAVVVNSPSNPTGLVYNADELRQFAEICVKHDLWIISDEIYERLVYGNEKHVSVASLSPEIFRKTITINGVSKAYAMTGWRIGYAAAPAEVIRAMETVQSHSASAPATFAQYGALHALKGVEDEIKPMLAAFEARNQRIHELMSQIEGVVCRRPMGAFYIFPNISAFRMDSREFARRLIDERHVAAVPGFSFGAPDNLRFSYACSMEDIEEGMRRFTAFCESLG
ncbi:MAG: pyridoxal phosphate-dependent aminotransferase [Kiritimatiellia bacterium]|jgi:aspartate aminotransferase